MIVCFFLRINLLSYGNRFVKKVIKGKNTFISPPTYHEMSIRIEFSLVSIRFIDPLILINSKNHDHKYSR
jgi:hypothetical protein